MSLSEGWEVFVDRLETIGARKWFGDHYKTVEVSKNGGDLEGATAAVDQEVALRAQAKVDEANAHADALEARAAVVRETGDVSAPDPRPAEEVAPVEAAAPAVVVPTIEELRAEQEKLQSEIAALEAAETSGKTPETEAAPAA